MFERETHRRGTIAVNRRPLAKNDMDAPTQGD
jgi:hypothetical protein